MRIDAVGDSSLGMEIPIEAPASGAALSPEEDGPGPEIGRRRFTIAALTGIALTAVPFLWILWGPWESPSPLRKTIYEDNFYDLQARAMFHGHLWLPKGAIGIEAFVHHGREYTYFGLFPSLVRMPVLAVTHNLDGKLTAPLILVAWVLTGLLTSLLLWRVRVMIRGDAVMGKGEAVAQGLLVATVTGGTVLLFLAATPFVFNEDIVWSVCLTIGTLFMLLGVLKKPCWTRVAASGAFMLAGNLDRATTGWACVVGAVLIAIWFWTGRGGHDKRRWGLPILAAGLAPLFIGFAVNYAKFGAPIGVSNYDQVWTSVNAYRRQFLASNHNSEWGTVFIPSDLLAYLRPNGLRFTSVFPFITLPSAPARALSGVLFDRRYRTASLPSSMPALFLLSCWGVVVVFRPRPLGKTALMRIVLVAGALCAAPLFVWGYIAPRYLGDFVPFLVLASAVAVVDVWRRLEGRSAPWRVGSLVALVAVCLFTIAANIGLAITPNEEWSTTQVLHYVEAQKAVSDLTGHRLNGRVVRVDSLPAWAPADQLYVVGECDGLYISDGEDYSTVPAQVFHRATWMTVTLGHGFQHVFRVSVHHPLANDDSSVSLVKAGATEVTASASAGAGGSDLLVLRIAGPGHDDLVARLPVSSGSSHEVTVATDLAKHVVNVSVDRVSYLMSDLIAGRPISVGPVPIGGTETLSVVDVTASIPSPTLCRDLLAR